MHFFVSDLHGRIDRYEKLFAQILQEKPESVFLGGDLLPRTSIRFHGKKITHFIRDYLSVRLLSLKQKMQHSYPIIFLIFGNDDPKIRCIDIKDLDGTLLFHIHKKKFKFQGYTILGYANVPPTPFQLKDWEKFDVSHYLDVGAISPLQGFHTVPVNKLNLDFYTIQKELAQLTAKIDFSRAIFLFHAPPYQTNLDRAALDGKKIDHVPLDVHVGSIAIKRMIENKQPYLTLHGHIHESTRITKSWKQKIGKTWSFNAATEPPDLAIIRFELNDLTSAKRILL